MHFTPSDRSSDKVLGVAPDSSDLDWQDFESLRPQFSPSEPGSQPPQHLPESAAVENFQRDCESGVNRWRTGQVDYPKELSISVNESVTYNAAVDVREDPLPADEVIVVAGKSGSEQIAVRCTVAAKLVAVGDFMRVDNSEEWVSQDFTPLGVAEWSWSVSADKPVDQELRLVIRPAVLTAGANGGLLYTQGSGDSSYADTSEATIVTEVKVRGTLLEQLAFWLETQWLLLVAIAGTLAAGVAGFRKWIQDQFGQPSRSVEEPSKKKKDKGKKK